MLRFYFSTLLFPLFLSIFSFLYADEHSKASVVSQEILHDKIRGGLLGQIIANLNGLPHENRYIAKPGNVTEYVPNLADGGRTDDDTDIEWVYIVEMQKDGFFVPYEKISDLWKLKINRAIWSSNKFVRLLFDVGVPPELTGSALVNPWASYNLAGQFASETFALVAPGMPQTASKLGTHYMRVVVGNEPLQTTQLFDSMIATAFLTDNIETIMDAGAAAVDPKSKIYEIVQNVRKWYKEYPDDWKKTRKLIHDTYTQQNDKVRDFNGCELNAAAVLGAFLYGKCDFTETCKHAFNFGWDADNVAATAGTLVGVIKGEKWLTGQGWKIKDVYTNTTRDNMPMDETITTFGNRLIELAEKNLTEHGGRIFVQDDKKLVEIPVEKSMNILSGDTLLELQTEVYRKTEADILSKIQMEQKPEHLARAAYLAVCLGFDKRFKNQFPQEWEKAAKALNEQEILLEYVFRKAVQPIVEDFSRKFRAVGFVPPPAKEASGTANITWDVQSDTWVATDGLGRTLPDAAQTGQPKKNKTVGIFYFLWNGHEGNLGPFDVTKILTQAPEARENANHPLWGPLMKFHHWGEPIFDYYVAEDDYVLRKHAQMLADAGIDVLFFDVTNQNTYPASYRALCRVFMEIRKQGNRTPQIAFLCPFGQPTRAVLPLWKELYSKGEFSELWFRWKGKPLILADSSMVMPEKQDYVFLDKKEVIPVEAKPGIPLGQTFVVDRPLKKVALRTPTWQTNGAVATVAIFKEGPSGKELFSQRFVNIGDNAWLTLSPEKPLPAGKYYLELRCESGKLGWWSVADGNRIPGGQAFIDRKPVNGALTIRITRIPEDETFDAILDFFTFRNPAVGYAQAPSKPDQWSWLQGYPQYGFYSSEDAPKNPGDEPKKIEEVSVSVAQNMLDNRMGTISSPRARGRSYHNGKEPPPEQCDFSGKNFAEQWNRAFELDPEFVFVTGWNEWIMMRFPKGANFHGADESEVNFIDQFNQEFSRDAEPMRGWHEDAYYYQLIANVRKFKGIREVEPVRSQPIILDGHFGDWKNVIPEFRDTIGDPAKRDFRGCAKGLTYVNQTGRNDIVAAKVSVDEQKQMLYFYVRTQEPFVGEKSEGLLLFLDIDTDPKTGWLGYDFLLDDKTLKKNIGGEYRWEQVGSVEGQLQKNEYETVVPFRFLGLKSTPKSILFKWADNIKQTGDWSDFTLNGDVAPNDRYNYKAVFRP